MYRVKAEAVSGLNVYAGGKWLKCIGNKPVRVGESVWTDGKVVYGNYKESQQPPVITAPQDQSIPICSSDDMGKYFYTFRNLSAKQLDAPEKTNYRLIVNNKRTVIGTHNQDIVALNIDDNGNIFAIKELRDTIGILTGIEILKNSSCVKTVSFDDLLERNLADAPFPAQTIDVQKQQYSSLLNYIDSAFIENVDNWACSILVSSFEVTTPTDHPLLNPLTEKYLYTGEYYKHWYLSPDGTFALDSETTIKHFYLATDGLHWVPQQIIQHSDNDLSKVRFILNDNYYYKCVRYYYDAPNDTYAAARFILYSPNGQTLFTFICFLYAHLTIAKVKQGYLLKLSHAPIYEYVDGYVTTTSITNEEEIHYHDGAPHLFYGVYLYRFGQWKRIIKEDCINERLRPMKKIKNWQNRIEEIAFDD